MFERIHIDGFRGMDDVAVGPFGRINLIVGPGGTAKTSLLEALFLHSGPARPALMISALQQRGIQIEHSPQELKKLLDIFFSVGREASGATIRGAWSGRDRESVLRSSEPQVIPLQSIDLIDGRAKTSTARPLVTYEVDLHEGGLDYPGKLHVLANATNAMQEERVDVPMWPTRYVGAHASPTSRALAPMWSQAEERGESDEIVALMKIIDPEIRAVRIASNEAGQAQIRVMHERLRSADEPALLGGWLPAALLLGSSLASVAEGLLLADEFDSAIHVSVLPKIARYIVEAARRLDVQVFLTTHREESVDAFIDQDDLSSDVKVVRARRRDGRFGFDVLDSERARYLRDDVGIDLRRTV